MIVLSLLSELRTCLKKQAWVSDHYSDEPFDSILSELFPSQSSLSCADLKYSGPDLSRDRRPNQALANPLRQGRRGEGHLRVRQCRQVEYCPDLNAD